MAQGDAREPRTLLKRTITDGGHGIGEGHLRQTLTAEKRTITDGRNPIGQRDFGQSVAATEGITADTCHRTWQVNISDLGTLDEIIGNHLYLVANHNIFNLIWLPDNCHRTPPGIVYQRLHMTGLVKNATANRGERFAYG